MTDDDRAAARLGAAGDLDIDLRLLELDPDAAPDALRRRRERRAVVLAPRHVRPRPPPALRHALSRRVGGVRRRQRRVRRRGRRRARGAERRRARAGLPAELGARAAARAAPRPARRALHAHAVLRAPTTSACCPTTSRTRCARRSAPVPPASTRSGGPTRTSSRRARGARPRAPRSPTPFAAQPRPRRRRARRGCGVARGARAAAGALADAVGDRLVVLRTDRIEPSKNIVRGFLAFDRLLEARPGLRGRVVFVAMVYPSRQGLAEYLAYANEVEQAVARDQRSLGDARLDSRSCSTIATTSPDRSPACSATTCCS